MTRKTSTVQQVNVWQLRLGQDPVGEDFLGRDELDHAARFRFTPDQVAFRARRTFLRTVLGEFLDIDPRTLKFDRTCEHCGNARHGRPRVIGHPNVEFSTASTSEIAVIATSRDGRIGIDVEQVERVNPAELAGLTATAFSERERAMFGLPTDQVSATAFTQAFAAKEAIGKADGRGLLVDVSTIADRWIVTPLPIPVPTTSMGTTTGALATAHVASITHNSSITEWTARS